MLFIDGVKSHDLKLVLDYVYQGEVKLYQDSLGSFLKATEKLKISGLSERAMEPRTKTSKDNETIVNEVRKEAPGPNIEMPTTGSATNDDKSQDIFPSDITGFDFENEFTQNYPENDSETGSDTQNDFSMKTEDGGLDEGFPESKQTFSGVDINGDGEKRVIVFDFKGKTNIEMLDLKIQELMVMNDFGSKKNKWMQSLS